ncbi:MAG: DNA polymerase III subunit beta, partial [Chromatiales bacterium]
MKIKTNRETLLEPLLQINGVVERRQTLPILANVLIKCETDQI